MSKYANDIDMMSQALISTLQRERDDAIKASMQDMVTVESLRAELEAVKKERDELLAEPHSKCCEFRVAQVEAELEAVKKERDAWKAGALQDEGY